MAEFAPPYYPNTELVGLAWLSQRVPEFVGLGNVATTLPLSTAWPNGGFVQARDLVGGAARIDIPQRRPLLQIDCWAVKPGSSKPRWALASYLAECVRNATESSSAKYSSPVALPADYLPAIVSAAFIVGDIRRIENDPSGYARFSMNLEVDWLRG